MIHLKRTFRVVSLITVTGVALVAFQNCSGFKGVSGLTGSSGSNASSASTSTPTTSAATPAVSSLIPLDLINAAKQTTVLGAQVFPASLPAGSPVTVTYNWIGVPMDSDYKVFVHVVDKTGAKITQDDHGVYPQTSLWSGPLTYTRAIEVPAGTPDGTYRIEVGLWYPNRVPLATALGAKPDASPDADYNMRYEVGSFVVDHTAAAPLPVPQRVTKTLDLTDFTLTFNDEFDGPLDVSPWGPNTKWISNKPDGQNFGYVGSSNAFSVSGGILDIKLTNTNGNWAGGILSSVDGKGNGFAQQYGYFEMRAKLPGTGGSWPAFWLLSQKAQQNSGQNLGGNVPAVELDILEQYGAAPYADMTYHYWITDQLYFALTSYIGDMFSTYHTYGMMVDPIWMVYFVDGVETGRQATPSEANQPFYVMVNLAIHDPNDANAKPVSDMLVDYVRVYQRKTAYAAPVAVAPWFVPVQHLGTPVALTSMLTSYKLRAPATSAGTAMIQDKMTFAKDEEFLLADAGGGKFTITNVGANLCLGIAGQSTTNGAALELETCATEPSQQFSLTLQADQSFELRSVLSNKCLGIADNSPNTGAKIIQWDCYGGPNEHYLIRDTTQP